MKYAVLGHVVVCKHYDQRMTRLTQREDLVCNWLYQLVHWIFVIVGLIWLVTRKASGVMMWLARMLIWSSVLVWRMMRFVVALYRTLIAVMLAIIWVWCIVLIWFGEMLYSLVIVLVQRIGELAMWIWGQVKLVWCWIVREFSEPAACLICVTLGVFSANALPTLALMEVSPMEWLNLTLPPLAIAAIAARVFDVRAYRRWCGSGKTRLGTRMLRAYSDGAMWPLLLRRGE